MKNNVYPKVLVVSSFKLYKDDNQTSITLRSYFEKWPKDRIAQVVCGNFNEEEKKKLENNVFVLSLKDIRILKYLLKEKRIPSATGDNTLPVIPAKATLLFRLKRSFRMFLIATAELCPYFISKELLNFISDFNADAVYTTLENPRVIHLVQHIQKISNIKIIPHFMDDYPSTVFKNPSTRIHRLIVLNKLKNLIASSPACFCISQSMCIEYTKRYEKEEFYPLMNCIEEYYGNSEEYFENEDIIKFCYTGGLHLQRDQVLEQLIKYMALIKDINFEFTIYTQKSVWDICSDQFSKFPFVSYGGYKNKDQILEKMKQSDVLVFAESFDVSVQNYTKFSISTKIPEYLSVGKNILAIGPKGIASIDYLKDNNAAYIITDLDDFKAINLVINDIINKKNSQIMIKNAKKLFIQNHLRFKQELLLKSILKG
jgi:hypothetical protein